MSDFSTGISFGIGIKAEDKELVKALKDILNHIPEEKIKEMEELINVFYVVRDKEFIYLKGKERRNTYYLNGRLFQIEGREEGYWFTQSAYDIKHNMWDVMAVEDVFYLFRKGELFKAEEGFKSIIRRLFLLEVLI